MSTSSYSSSAAFLRLLPSSFSPSNRKPRVLYPHKRPTFRVSSLRLGFEEILVVTHNKVRIIETHHFGLLISAKMVRKMGFL